MTETWAEEVTRLQQEIADRQSRLHRLICGDPREGVTVLINVGPLFHREDVAGTAD